MGRERMGIWYVADAETTTGNTDEVIEIPIIVTLTEGAIARIEGWNGKKTWVNAMMDRKRESGVYRANVWKSTEQMKVLD